MEYPPLYLILDLETPGLDPKLGILEVAYAVVEDLDKADEAPIHSHLIWTDVAAAVQSADSIVKGMHTESGLWDALSDVNEEKIHLSDAEDNIFREVQRVGQGSFDRPVYLLGNSIALDRAFIAHWWHLLDARLHYRMLDLTSVNLLIQGIGGPNTKVPTDPKHRAADDVRDTIAQLGNQIYEIANRVL